MPDQSSAATEHAIIQEITGPLQNLPDDPVALVHAEFPTALRGYDRVAVDDYVQQMSQLVAELQATRSPESAVRRALERVGEQISGILQRAHETAEQITAQSRREAEDRLQQARGEAARIAGNAEQRVKDLDADTDRIWLERQRIVADAEDLAAQLVALTKSAADRFPADDESGAASDQTTPFDADQAESASPAGASAGMVEPEPPAPAHGDSAPSSGAYEDRAPAPEASGYAEGGEDEEDFFDDDEGPYDDEVQYGAGAAYPEDSPTEIDDVTKTVAFAPLKPRGEGVPPADAPEAPGETPPASTGASEPERLDEGESTAIIPPASQAANRRQQH